VKNYTGVIALILAALAVWYARKNALQPSGSGSPTPHPAVQPSQSVNIASTANSTNGVPDHANYSNPLSFQKSLGSGAVSTVIPASTVSIGGAFYSGSVRPIVSRPPFKSPNPRSVSISPRPVTQPQPVGKFNLNYFLTQGGKTVKAA
jgi:hypothetical protein